MTCFHAASNAPDDELAGGLGEEIAHELLHQLGDRWTVSVLCALDEGPQRFMELHVRLGISRRLLSATLRALVQSGFAARRPGSDPNCALYELTPVGASLGELVDDLSTWCDEHRGDVAEARRTTDLARSTWEI